MTPANLSGSGWNAMIADWLAGLFIAPMSATMVASHRSGLASDLLAYLAGEPGYGHGIAQMQAALGADGAAEATRRRLAAAFTRLFDGAGGIALYESAYLGPSGRLFQAPVAAMNQQLRAADRAICDATGEPPDHLSIELALLATQLRQGDLRRSAELRDVHLLTWVPEFAEHCGKADPTGFYAGAAQVLLAFLTAEAAQCADAAAFTMHPAAQTIGATP